jgi:hypothetical protein
MKSPPWSRCPALQDHAYPANFRVDVYETIEVIMQLAHLRRERYFPTSACLRKVRLD